MDVRPAGKRTKVTQEVHFNVLQTVSLTQLDVLLTHCFTQPVPSCTVSANFTKDQEKNDSTPHEFEF